MKQLGVAAILFLTAVTIGGGCGGKAAPAAAPAAAEPASTPTPVAEPAPAPTGPKSSPASVAALAELEELRAQACACTTPACERDVQAGFAAFMERHASTSGSEQEAEQAGQIAEAMMGCLETVTADADQWNGGEGLTECDAYAVAVERYVACDKAPQESRDATQAGLDAMRGAWSADLPPEAIEIVNDSCRQATENLVAGAIALGCAM